MQVLGLMFCGVRQKVYMSRGIKFIHTVLDYLYIHRQCEREQGKKTKIFQHSVTYAFESRLLLFLFSLPHMCQHNSSGIHGERLLPFYDLLISFQFLWCVLTLLHISIQTNNLYMPIVPQLLLEFHVYINACLHANILYVCASEYRYQWVPEWTSHTLELELRGSCKSPASWVFNTDTGNWIQTAGTVYVVNCGSIALDSKIPGEYFIRRKW